VILLDTGPLVAALNTKDKHHKASADLLRTHPGPLLVPGPVLTEVCWLLESTRGPEAEAAFLDTVAHGELDLVALTVFDIQRMAELIRRYADLPLGAADASVIAVAERLNITDIATLDHRHFTVVRPSHTTAFNLLP
jgi:predicted nucleic acid-binding protein